MVREVGPRSGGRLVVGSVSSFGGYVVLVGAAVLLVGSVSGVVKLACIRRQAGLTTPVDRSAGVGWRGVNACGRFGGVARGGSRFR